jgi:hypothetical protein
LGKKFKDFPGFSRPVDTCVLQEKSWENKAASFLS